MHGIANNCKLPGLMEQVTAFLRLDCFFNSIHKVLRFQYEVRTPQLPPFATAATKSTTWSGDAKKRILTNGGVCAIGWLPFLFGRIGNISGALLSPIPVSEPRPNV